MKHQCPMMIVNYTDTRDHLSCSSATQEKKNISQFIAPTRSLSTDKILNDTKKKTFQFVLNIRLYSNPFNVPITKYLFNKT